MTVTHEIEWSYEPDTAMRDLVHAGFFNQSAEQLDRFRPGYTEGIIDALASVTGLRSGDTICEVGAGTGHATKLLAQRGFNVLAIEPGADARRIAEKNTGSFPNVRILPGNFEDVSIPPHSVSVALGAMAWHWVDPRAQYNKAYGLLRPGGYVANLWSVPILDNRSHEFWDKFDALAQPYDDSVTVPRKEDLGIMPPFDINLFSEPVFLTHDVPRRFSAVEIAGYYATQSSFAALPETTQEGELADLERLVDDEFGGHVDLTWMCTLGIARRLNILGSA